jgi:thioredoxin
MRYISLLIFTFLFSACHSQNTTEKLDPATFQKEIEKNKDAVVLDVRTPSEFSEGYIANAINIDFRENHFSDRVKFLDLNKTYFVYCLSGGRSGEAAQFMRENGFKKVFELKGGMLSWKKNNLPLSSISKLKVADKISFDDYEKMTKSDKIVLIDFYAPWCGPCKQMMPILEELSNEYKGKATIIRINIDENKSLTSQLKIDEIPFFKLYRDGAEKGNYIGQMDKKSFIRILN